MQVDVPGFKGGDRTSLDLPAEDEELLKALGNTGKPLVAVLRNGSALSVNWAAQHANAILDAWYSGEEGGTAVAQTSAGANNPAGRLPVTFYRGIDQLPPFEDHAMKNRTYRYLSEPLFPLGFGLSYSMLTYHHLKLSNPELDAGNSRQLDAEVSNAGQRDGEEVVELYLTFPNLPGSPLRALRGFKRIHAAAGATQHVAFNLQPRDLSLVNERGGRVVTSGWYQVRVGGGQPGTAPGVEATLLVRGGQTLPE